MTAFDRLKPGCTAPDLDRLGVIVRSVIDRSHGLGLTAGYHAEQVFWLETVELARSIEHDDGWLLFVDHRGEPWERLILYLDAPQVFLRSPATHVEAFPDAPHWSYTLCAAINRAKRARLKRLGKAVPAYTTAVLVEMRERRLARWGAA
jgi:hypothetical protein